MNGHSLVFRGPVRATYRFDPRGFASFGGTPYIRPAPRTAPADVVSSGLEGFRIGEAMSRATMEAASGILELAGLPGGFQTFHVLYGLTTKGKARPATQAVSGMINGQPFSMKRLVRSVY